MHTIESRVVIGPSYNYAVCRCVSGHFSARKTYVLYVAFTVINHPLLCMYIIVCFVCGSNIFCICIYNPTLCVLTETDRQTMIKRQPSRQACRRGGGGGGGGRQKKNHANSLGRQKAEYNVKTPLPPPPANFVCTYESTLSVLAKSRQTGGKEGRKSSQTDREWVRRGVWGGGQKKIHANIGRQRAK